MKALSVKQPWASLIVSGLKDIENRSWSTNYRGPILIHASKVPVAIFKDQIIRLLDFEKYQLVCRKGLLLTDIISPGVVTSAILGQVEIVDCVQNHSSIWAEAGQWHWVLANAKKFKHPIRGVKGALSFWEYTLRDEAGNSPLTLQF